MTDRLSLSRTALRLGLTYHQVRALLLKGDLKGGQDANDRFYVDPASVERWALQRSAALARKSRRASGGRS